MLGFLWSTIVGIGAAISGGKHAIDNNDSKKRAIEKDNKRIQKGEVPWGTYHKLKNGRYGDYTYDGKQVDHKIAPNGDHLITDIYGEKIYRNITEEQKKLTFDRNKQKADENTIAVSTGLKGKTYYGSDRFGKKQYIDRGIEYRNINTGEKYYIVRLPLTDPKIEFRKGRCYTQDWTSEWVEFYMNEKGHLICVTDDERKENPTFTTRNDIKDFINYFNSLQREKNGGWHKLIRKGDFSYLDNTQYVKYYYCTDWEYHSLYESKKTNKNRDLLEI